MSSIKERGREVLGKVTGTLQSAIDQSQSELGKLQSQAAGAPDASKVRIRAKIGETQARQDAGQEKLRASLETQISDAKAQIADLEAAAAGVTGAARDKIVHDADQAKAQRSSVQNKLQTNLEAELAEAESELATLQKEAADAGPEVAPKIMVRAEWARLRRDTMQERLQAARQL